MPEPIRIDPAAPAVRDVDASAVAHRRWQSAVVESTARRLGTALQSSAAALRTVDGRLDALAALDWTATGVASRVDAATRDARASLRREANAALERLDGVPLRAVAFVLGRTRNAVHAAVTTLERGARRVANEAAAADGDTRATSA